MKNKKIAFYMVFFGVLFLFGFLGGASQAQAVCGINSFRFAEKVYGFRADGGATALYLQHNACADLNTYECVFHQGTTLIKTVKGTYNSYGYDGGYVNNTVPVNLPNKPGDYIYKVSCTFKDTLGGSATDAKSFKLTLFNYTSTTPPSISPDLASQCGINSFRFAEKVYGFTADGGATALYLQHNACADLNTYECVFHQGTTLIKTVKGTYNSYGYDGGYVNNTVPVNLPNKPGDYIYKVSCTFKDTLGVTTSKTKSFTLNLGDYASVTDIPTTSPSPPLPLPTPAPTPKTPPTSGITSPIHPNLTFNVGDRIEFKGIYDKGSWSSVVAYQWFTKGCGEGVTLSTQQSFPHSFSTAGSHSIYYRVKAQNADGSVATWSLCAGPVNITVNLAPVARVDGSCGSRNAKTYASTVAAWPATDTSCIAGTSNPPSPVFPATGATTTWTCAGSGVGTPANCTATRSSATAPLVPGAPTCTAFYDGSLSKTINSGQQATLTWSSVNATKIGYVCTTYKCEPIYGKNVCTYNVSGRSKALGEAPSKGTGLAQWINETGSNKTEVCTFTFENSAGQVKCTATLDVVPAPSSSSGSIITHFELRDSGPFKTGKDIALRYRIDPSVSLGSDKSCKIIISGPETGEKTVPFFAGLYQITYISHSKAGNYNYKLECTNNGVTSIKEVANVAVILDSNPPVPVIVSPRNGASVGADVVVPFTGSGVGPSGIYRWYNGMTAGCGATLLATRNSPEGFTRKFGEGWNSTALQVETVDGRKSTDVAIVQLVIEKDPKCYNGVQDPGEDRVDCGGLICRACKATAGSNFSCYGDEPENASLCLGDDIGLTVNTKKTLANSSTSCKSDDVKCEYVCKEGEYIYSSGKCVKDYSSNECLGDTPQNAIMCEGDDSNIKSSEVHKGAFPYCTANRKCEYVCKNWQNYELDGYGGFCKKVER